MYTVLQSDMYSHSVKSLFVALLVITPFRILISRIYMYIRVLYECVCVCACTFICVCHNVWSGLWHILTGYGYQMISEDQKEAEVVKDGHVATLVVSV